MNNRSIVMELQGIRQSFPQGGGRLEVIRDASLSLFSGELVALVGPSGSGKSTLLHIAGLLEKPFSGKVIVGGKESQNDAQRTLLRRATMGFVYQYHHLLPEFSAKENVMLPSMIAEKGKSHAEKRAEELLAQVGLAERLDHRPAQLSGGEQQRVAIARALANHPAILFADEPTGNLDIDTAERIFVLLADLVRKNNVAALIATHNMDIARRMDRVVTLEHGKLISL